VPPSCAIATENEIRVRVEGWPKKSPSVRPGRSCRGLAFSSSARSRTASISAAETLVREGVPFRDAHEQVAATVREGTFAPPSQVTKCYLEGRGIDVGAAVAAAKKRWS
jgi:hypothetical protein